MAISVTTLNAANQFDAKSSFGVVSAAGHYGSQ